MWRTHYIWPVLDTVSDTKMCDAAVDPALAAREPVKMSL